MRTVLVAVVILTAGCTGIGTTGPTTPTEATNSSTTDTPNVVIEGESTCEGVLYENESVADECPDVDSHGTPSVSLSGNHSDPHCSRVLFENETVTEVDCDDTPTPTDEGDR